MFYNKCCTIVKCVVAILMIVCFGLNSWIIFDHYAAKKMVTSSNIVMSKDGVQKFPAIIICRDKPYDDPKKDMSKLEDFIANTLSLYYWVYGPTGYIDTNSTLLKREYVYSISRGMCYVLKFTGAVNMSLILCDT